MLLSNPHAFDKVDRELFIITRRLDVLENRQTPSIMVDHQGQLQSASMLIEGQYPSTIVAAVLQFF